MTHLYMSGMRGGERHFIEQEAYRAPYRLFSMHGNYFNVVMKRMAECQSYDTIYKTILLDSGAFTAWNKGHKTTVQEVIKAYDAFVEYTKGMFDNVWAINLDVIPGEAGRDPTHEEIEQAVKESDENLKILQDRYGDMILPVFHQGESQERLYKVIEQAKYICVSPRNDLPEKSRVEWARNVHTLTANNRTHGLATTGSRMLGVSWYSVDSATCVHVAVFGMLMLELDGKLATLAISPDSSAVKEADKHFDTLSPYMREVIEKKIADDIFTHEELRQYTNARLLFNLKQLSTFADNVNKRCIDQPTLFGI